MSQENVELAYRAIDAFNRRDLDAYLTLTDDDVEVIPRAVAIEGGDHYHGHEGVRRWWKDLFGVFPDFTAEVVEVHDLGDVTLTLLRQRARGAGSDTPTEESTWNVARWLRGKCVWWRTFDARADALEAVGLSEQAMSNENVEVVRAAFEAWNAGNMDALRELYDPDVILRTVEDWPEPGPYVGREAVMRFFGQLRETWDVETSEPISDFIDAADHVVVRYIWRGTARRRTWS